MIALDPGPRFSLGRVVITRAALARLAHHDVQEALRRHVRGDWGDLNEHDTQVNERSLDQGLRVCSRYVATNGTAFWVITEHDRSQTTVLLPEDY